ncbi:Lysophospholipase L1 [Dethiosulfatibacter aminovorans DSM 17477]|uniref:Lysophospholipase L1 n=1 Tax=Dethiosulfatibacter aminovorans DSM 17477 TaxID=1121476 RepID=A0A1M6ASE4_9FIRM|nr:GDSL-type esterase/lipase family protein [Dethiosulfatibacter aminovorans]SHI39390.1 Lysophospholipase L1 [Dethiosulfatibacter aminovorans DSM 17477]
MYRKSYWHVFILIFIIGIVVFIAGFSQALSIGREVTKETVDEEDVEVEKPQEYVGEYRIIALGDSLARGTGDISGEGFVGRMVESGDLNGGKPVNLYNLSVEGMRSIELVEQVKDPQTVEGFADADIIIISIGGNDLRDILNESAVDQAEAFQSALGAYLYNVDFILKSIRSANEGGLVVFLGLFNPGDGDDKTRNMYLLEWNNRTWQLMEMYENTLYVPTYDLFKYNSNEYISVDGLHPNDEGYEAIAKRILGSIK